MGTVFAPAYANLTIGYREITVYSIICQSYALASKDFENVMLRFLGDSQILLKIIFIKLDDLLSILNQVHNDFELTMKKSQMRLPFLDIMIKKIGAKISVCIYNKPRDSKLYGPFTSSYPGYCLTNIPSSLISRRICTIVENANVKKKR